MKLGARRQSEAITGVRSTFPNLSVIENRVANLVRAGGGEDFTVFTATFDGMPAVIIDEGTAAELLPDQEQADATLDGGEGSAAAPPAGGARLTRRLRQRLGFE